MSGDEACFSSNPALYPRASVVTMKSRESHGSGWTDKGYTIDEMKGSSYGWESVEMNRQQAREAHDGLIGEDERTGTDNNATHVLQGWKENKKLGGAGKKCKPKDGKGKRREGRGKKKKKKKKNEIRIKIKIKTKISGSATWTSVTYLERATMGGRSQMTRLELRARCRETGSVGVITLNYHGAISKEDHRR